MNLSKSGWTILLLSIFLIVALGVLGWVLFENFVWQLESKSMASQAAALRALEDFRRGQQRLLQLREIPEQGVDSGPVKNDWAMENSGRSEGQYEIWNLLQITAIRPTRLVMEEYIESYNRFMKFHVEHPEMFDEFGRRKSVQKQIKKDSSSGR